MRTRTSTMIGVSSLMALSMITIAIPVRAVVLSLGGLDGPAIVDMASTSGLYASDRDEVTTLIAQIGAIAPGGDIFDDLGVPYISPEGDVVFGGETVGLDSRPRWDIYRANVGVPGNERIVPVLQGATIPDNCHPDLRMDPYAVAGANGMVAFLAPEASGGDAVFRYQNGRLNCVARIGDRTAQGHKLKLLYFGSADIAENGDIAFLARVREAGEHGAERTVVVTLEGNSLLREIAREGTRAPDGISFGSSFGRPAIVSSRLGDLVAFTNRKSSVTSAYVGCGGRLSRGLRTGAHTEIGILT